MTRIGIVGLGLAVKPHALALKDLAGRAEVAGAFSPSAGRRAEFAKTWGFPVSESLEALLADPSVGALIVLTPPRTHYDIATRAARAGKHVLLEKPVDAGYDAAARLVQEVEAAGRTLGVVFQFRYRDSTRTMRELLAAGELGELLSVSASVRWWRPAEYYAQPGRGMRERDGGGVLLTQAIHTLDVMLHLAGPAQEVDARCVTSPLRSIDTEDIACAAVGFANGAVGVVDATTTAYPGYPERIDFAGTRGSAVMEGERLTVHRHGRDTLHIGGSFAGGSGADPMAFSHEPHRRLIEDFLGAIEQRRQPVSDGRTALRVHALIDAMLASSQRGQRVRVPGV